MNIVNTKSIINENVIFSLSVMAMISGLLAIDIHLASMPYIMKFMHTDKQHMGQSISFFLFGAGSSMLVYGPLSDKYGRRVMMLIGLSIATLASFCSVLTDNITSFLITRLLQGIGAGACMGLGRVILADIVQGPRYATVASFLTIITGLSPLIGPIIGGYIQSLINWQTNFYLLGTMQLITLILFVLFFPETNKHKNTSLKLTHLLQNYKYLLKHSPFVGFTILSGIGLSSSMLYATMSSFILQIEFHTSPILYGWLTMMASIGIIISCSLIPVSVKRFGLEKSIFIGLVIMLISGILLIVFNITNIINLSLLMLTVFLALFSYPLVVICSSTCAITPYQDKRGAAGALFGGFQMLMAFGVSASASFLAQHGVILLGSSYAILAVFGCLIYYILIKKA